jgi:hypothetical protein
MTRTSVLDVDKGPTPQANSVLEMVVMMIFMGSWVQEGHSQLQLSMILVILRSPGSSSFCLRHSDGNRKKSNVTHIVCSALCWCFTAF